MDIYGNEYLFPSYFPKDGCKTSQLKNDELKFEKYEEANKGS